MDLGRGPSSGNACNLNSSYLDLLESSFKVGVTTRVEVRRSLNNYWIGSGDAKTPDSDSVSDSYRIGVPFLDGPVVVAFDENGVLLDIRTDD